MAEDGLRDMTPVEKMIYDRLDDLGRQIAQMAERLATLEAKIVGASEIQDRVRMLELDARVCSEDRNNLHGQVQDARTDIASIRGTFYKLGWAIVAVLLPMMAAGIVVVAKHVMIGH